ncbi:hypothetical protein [Shewanella maritima]|uniref:hypothetical protein n=1 Tax=Shewanella maritima TaxID=2520507 RepID=UPI0037355FE7
MLRTLKNTFLALLFFSCFAAAHAAASPLKLFLHSCAQFKASPVSNHNNLARLTVSLERELISLFNFNDRINYYRTLPLNPQQRSALLQCQIKLADEYVNFIKHSLDTSHHRQLISSSQSTAEPIKQMEQRKQLDYIERLLTNYHQQINIAQKSQITSLTAFINGNFQSSPSSLYINQDECVLSDTELSTKQQLTHYLLNQPKPKCRQIIWQAYQGRLKADIKPAIDKLMLLQKDKKFKHKTQSIDLTREQVLAFLAVKTQQLDSPPWDLPQQLKLLPSQSKNTIPGHHYTKQAFDVLKTLELKFIEVADPEGRVNKIDQHLSEENNELSRIETSPDYGQLSQFQVWYKMRYLGLLSVQFDAKNISYAAIQKPVLGHQHGHVMLSVTPELTGKFQHKLIKQISYAINAMAASGQFYVLNHSAETQSQRQVAQYWLIEYLTRAMNFIPSPREALIARYQQQLRLFRAKLALVYVDYLDSTEQPLMPFSEYAANTFNQHFNADWHQASDAIYSFRSIARRGINYYQPLWSEALAQLLFSETTTDQQQAIFDVLVINSENLQLAELLPKLFTQSSQPEQLTRRMSHATHSQ